MNKTILISIEYEDLRDLISECVRRELDGLKQNDPKDDPEDLVKIQEIAKMLDVSKVTIHAWKREGKIPFLRKGRRIYFRKAEVLKSLKEVKIIHH